MEIIEKLRKERLRIQAERKTIKTHTNRMVQTLRQTKNQTLKSLGQREFEINIRLSEIHEQGRLAEEVKITNINPRGTVTYNFKVGDKVKVIHSDYISNTHKVGAILTVTEIHSSGAKLFDGENSFFYSDYEFESVEEPLTPYNAKVGMSIKYVRDGVLGDAHVDWTQAINHKLQLGDIFTIKGIALDNWIEVEGEYYSFPMEHFDVVKE